MRVMMLLPDMGVGPAKGYQVRANGLAHYLRRSGHSVLIVTCLESTGADVSLKSLSRPADRVRSFAHAAIQGLPFQSALFDGTDIADAARLIVQQWHPDVVLVVTERIPRTTIALATVAPVVIDVVDAMARNMELRARASRWTPFLWRREARAFRRTAPLLQRAVTSTVVIAGRERSEYPDSTVIAYVEDYGGSVSRGAPEWDLVFSGNLGYWPNERAAIEFCREIVPRVRSELPNTTALVAGRHPTRALVRECRRYGVKLEDDVADMRLVLARCRLSVAPLRYATGLQIKVLEALSVGTPVLAYPSVSGGDESQLTGLVSCDGPVEMASAAIQFLAGRTQLAVDTSLLPVPAKQLAQFEVLLFESCAR